jgi:glycosyltransferase involved in cell wall biosynthesis
MNEFLDIEEALFLLSACDAVVFPYQRSEESASGAVRLGLAAGRPVLTTPLPIFSDLSGIIYELPGTEAKDIAEGIVSLLADEDRKAEVLQRQRDWVRAHSWAAQAARMSNIIHGCFEETHGVELRAPEHTASVLTQSPKHELQPQASSDLLHGQDLQR